MKWTFEATARAPSELRFSEFFSLNYRLLADFLSDLGKRVKLVKFEAKHEYLCFGRLENIKIPHIHLKFTICVWLNGYQFKIKASKKSNWSQVVWIDHKWSCLNNNMCQWILSNLNWSQAWRRWKAERDPSSPASLVSSCQVKWQVPRCYKLARPFVLVQKCRICSKFRFCSKM